MDISYRELKNKEIINLADGKKLGHVIDVLFDSVNGKVSGIVVPGEKKIFRKCDDIFIPLEKVRKIGDDVVLIRFEVQNNYMSNSYTGNSRMQNYYIGDEKRRENVNVGQSRSNSASYIRYRPLNNNKYK